MMRIFQYIIHSKYRIIENSEAMPLAGIPLAIAPRSSDLRGEIVEGSVTGNEKSPRGTGAGRVRGPGLPLLLLMSKSEMARMVIVILDIHRPYKQTPSSGKPER